MTKKQAHDIIEAAFKQHIPNIEDSILQQIGTYIMTPEQEKEKVDTIAIIKELNKFAKFVSVAKERLRSA